MRGRVVADLGTACSKQPRLSLGPPEAEALPAEYFGGWMIGFRFDGAESKPDTNPEAKAATEATDSKPTWTGKRKTTPRRRRDLCCKGRGGESSG